MGGDRSIVRLNITVEGQTEEEFVSASLAPYLGQQGVFAKARSVITGTGRSPANGSAGYQFRGGLRSYRQPQEDIAVWMREDRGQDACFTTMFDLYALPNDWPGWNAPDERPDVYRYVRQLEKAFAGDIADRRFIPYIQVHEFEALLLSEPRSLLAPHPEAKDAVTALEKAVGEAGGPELVNDGSETHPARRIQDLIPRYRKTVSGPAAARGIGINCIREKCPHFNDWLERLIALAQ